MGLGGISHWVILLIIVLVLFGVGRVSGLMGELGKGIKSFKKGMADEDEAPRPAEQQRQLPPQQPIDITAQRPAEPAPQTPPPPSADETPRSS